MEIKFIVKNFLSQQYYCGVNYGWSDVVYLVDYFDSHEDAEIFIMTQKESGRYQIEKVYFV